MFTMSPKEPPKWYQIRKQASRFLMWLARKINPDCLYWNAYVMEQMTKAHMDTMVYGQGAIEIGGDPLTFKHKPFKDLWKEQAEQHWGSLSSYIKRNNENESQD